MTSWEFVGDATELGDEEPVDAVHRLVWAAALVWQGEGISGSYTVEDTWSTTDGLSGSMSAQGSICGIALESEE